MHAGMALKEFEGSIVLRALRALEDASNVALAVGVTRIPQMPVMENIGCCPTRASDKS
jgi:hypothetical protein